MIETHCSTSKRLKTDQIEKFILKIKKKTSLLMVFFCKQLSGRYWTHNTIYNTFQYWDKTIVLFCSADAQ